MIWTAFLLCALFSRTRTSPTPPPSALTSSPCLISSSGLFADCLGQQLDSVPWHQLPTTLETIDLSYNKLTAIHAEDFSQFPNLRVLLLTFNNISHIDDNAFLHNPILENLNIFNNSLHEIPAKALQPLSNLKILFMSNNLYKSAKLAESFANFAKLQVLSLGGHLVMGLKKGDFEPLRNISLQTFAIRCSSNLSYYERGSLEVIQTKQMGFDMAIDTQPNALLDMLGDLANKSFTDVKFRNLFEFTYYTGVEDIFQGLVNVTAHRLIFYRGKFNENLLRMLLLNLQKTPIKRLRLQYIDFARSPSFSDSGAESSITDLKLDRLDLWYISNPDILRFDWRFTWLNGIRQLSIQHVYLNFAPCDAWLEMRDVEILDVSNNRLRDEYIYNRRCVYKGTLPNLRTFNLTNNELTSLRDLSSLTRYFNRMVVMDVSNNKLGSAAYSSGCIWHQNITRFIAHHNEFVSEALLCLPTTVEYLDLSYCNLDQLEMTFFEKATNLKELLLSGNKIKYIPPSWKSPSLQSLELDGNSFGVITIDSFQEMPLLSSLKGGNNPYHCTCELHAFVENTMSKEKVNLTDWPWNYHCYHPQPLLNTLISKYFPGRVACDIRLVILICVATTAVVIIILMVICYIFDLPWYTKATYQIIRAKYRAYQESTTEGVVLFTYHAFISYSHSDAEWVKEQLLPALEGSKDPYRLCIHERDFMPGKWIIDNIIENIENSRKVIFVLSRNFVNSEWCNYELYFAQQRAMGKSFTDVILVVKEPIDPGSLPNKYCKLRKMLSTKTYLEWPQQVNQQAFFWAQLRSVLGRPSPVRSRSFSLRSLSLRSRLRSEENRPLESNGGLSVAVVGEPRSTEQNRGEEEVNQRQMQLPVAGP
ncbi:toll-like receptor 18 [Periophthalmus magnuspinnatus]|uniref:toll-like receptor 18 n=1 Tax=Periophthalmus magnuspinnatus TaxID=409849 RepID=UPI0024372E72|nr:toll-like receptor 18 [Periophthalmus magnuspinnatus]